MAISEPAYLKLLHRGELQERVARSNEHLSACDMCGWKGGKGRTIGKLGVCRTGLLARISSYGPHHGEENPLRGWRR